MPIPAIITTMQMMLAITPATTPMIAPKFVPVEFVLLELEDTDSKIDEVDSEVAQDSLVSLPPPPPPPPPPPCSVNE